MIPLIENNGPSFLRIKIDSPKFKMIKLELRCEQGYLKSSGWEEINKGMNSIDVDVSSLMKGFYNLSISDHSGDLLFTDKFGIKR